MNGTDQLPATPFAELAFELRIYARREAIGNEKVEEYIARHPSDTLKRTLADLQASALLIGKASTVLSILARHEAAVRALVTGEAAPSLGDGHEHQARQ